MEVSFEKAKEVYECLVDIDPHPIAYVYACWHEKEVSEGKVIALMKKAIEALGKQIPKEPDWEGGTSFYEDDATAYCPECSYYFEDELLYCPECGQKILWP